MEDTISRRAVLDKFEPWLKVKDYNDGELNMLKAILYEIRFMPSARSENVCCKDCKYNYGLTHGGEFNPDDIVCTFFDTDGMQYCDFCSYGEVIT